MISGNGLWNRLTRAFAIIAVSGGLLALQAPQAKVHAADGSFIKVGLLTCAAGLKIGLLLGSSEKVSCSFVHDGNESEHYDGRLSKLGLDIGITVGSVIIWTVFAKQDVYKSGSLTGAYVGVSAEETAVIGIGGNLLVGGSQNSISLQPLSVQGQAGLNLAIGVSKLTLSQVR